VDRLPMAAWFGGRQVSPSTTDRSNVGHAAFRPMPASSLRVNRTIGARRR